MLSEKQIPTALEDGSDGIHDFVDIVTSQSLKGRRLTILFHAVCWGLAVFWMWVTCRWTPLVHAQRTRKLFEQMGYLWIKVGQFLSLRTDLFSKEFCNELARLQYRANGFSPELARRTIEQAVGGPIEQFFEKYEEYPFAAASIAQVHRAHLKRENVEVVIKVIRPNTEAIYAKDRLFFNSIVRMLMRIKALAFTRLDEMMWELDQIMIEETDYRFELSNLERMRRNLRKHNIYVPKPFPDYCTKHVLVTEYVPGVLMSKYIKVSDSDPQRITAWEMENNVDPKRVGRRLYLSFMRQLFEENLFHGDLHPGNILMLRDSRLALIDFGTVGRIERAMWRKYLFIIKAIASGDLDKAADLVLSLCPVLPMVDIESVKQQMIRALRSWMLRTPLKKMDYHDKSLTEVTTELTKIMTRHKMMVTWSFMKIDRTWGTMDASIKYLNPGVNYPKLFRSYFLARQRRTFRKIMSMQTLRYVATEIPEVISEYTLFIDPQLRAASRSFQGATSKIADALRMVFSFMSSSVILFGLGLVVVFLHQHYKLFEKISYEKEDVVHTVVLYLERVPLIDYELWGIPALVTLYLWHKLFSLKKRFGQKDVRLPTASTAS